MKPTDIMSVNNSINMRGGRTNKPSPLHLFVMALLAALGGGMVLSHLATAREIDIAGELIGLSVQLNELSAKVSDFSPLSHHQQNAETATVILDGMTRRIEKYKTTYQYAPPAAVEGGRGPSPECGSTGPFYPDFFKLPGAKRSRYDEDKTIMELFFQTKLKDDKLGRGTYIELGGFDGQTESNSRYFDLCLNWQGLLIEGQPTTFQKLFKARPNAHRLNFAPSCSAEYEAVNKTVQFALYPMTNAGIRGKAKTYDAKPMVSVPCGPLGPVLEDIFGDQHINFFSLDVEGAEVMVLKTIDFDRVNIDVMMIEIENNFCGKVCPAREEIRAIMKEAGYGRYEGLIRASDVYVRPNSEFVLPGIKFAD